ncbi:MAG: hypothetical protein ABSC08_03955 [Bryobacteraceae bacterium]|jgi:hypothetical protein
MSDYEMLNLKNGGRWLFWLTNAPSINEYIRQFALSAVKAELLEPALRPTEVGAAQGAMEAHVATSVLINRGGRYGGIRIPHFHSAGDVYLLNDQQWSAFSEKVLGGVRDKLAKTHSIGYDQLMEVADAAAQL